MTGSVIALSHQDHRRDKAGLRYVYPVLSRRAQGVSLGINLNPNHACNWRCVYCQVQGLVRGAAPPLDVSLLKEELYAFLQDFLLGRLALKGEEGPLLLRDVAFSGDGEPTTCREFPLAVAAVEEALSFFGLLEKTSLTLITNGSGMEKPFVQEGLAQLSRLGGEVWFKFDTASAKRQMLINGTAEPLERRKKLLLASLRACPTWIQTCLFSFAGLPPPEPPEEELAAYTAFLEELIRTRLPLRGVLLYGLARSSAQKEAPLLSPAPPRVFSFWKTEIERLGLEARVFP